MPSTGMGSGPQSTDHMQQLPIEHSKDNQTHEEQMALFEWARMITVKYPYPDLEEDQSNVVERTPPAMSVASESVELSIRRLGGIAEFERVARALGWTPPGPGSTCTSVLSPSMSDSAQSLDGVPTEPGRSAESADLDLADLQPDMSALSTIDAPSPMTTEGAIDTFEPMAIGQKRR